jgi:hypothetical protein
LSVFESPFFSLPCERTHADPLEYPADTEYDLMHTEQEALPSDQHPGRGRDDQDRLRPHSGGKKELPLYERAGMQEDDEDAGMGTNLRFGGSYTTDDDGPIVLGVEPTVKMTSGTKPNTAAFDLLWSTSVGTRNFQHIDHSTRRVP